MKKKLYRNPEEKMVAGILAGFADYFGGDVTLWRVAFVILLFPTAFFPPVIAYIIFYFIIPERPAGAADDVKTYVVND